MGARRLKESLHTADPLLAKGRARIVVPKLRSKIEAAKQHKRGGQFLDLATSLRTALKNTTSSEEAEAIVGIAVDFAERLLGKPLGNTYGVPSDELEYDPKREKEAAAFHQFATGQTTPVDHFVDQWIAEAAYRPRTEGDQRRAIKRLKDWGADTIEAVTRKKAGAFISHLLTPDIPHWSGDRATVSKIKSSLSAYWLWLKGKGHVEANPWAEQTIAKPKASQEGLEGKERPFTDDEVFTLLHGPADSLLADLMRIAALSGMRMDEICSLKVAECADKLFKITRAKTDAGLRSVPIHPDLEPIIKRRVKGKKPDQHIFEELTLPSKESTREISMPAVKRFSRYIREVNVAVLIDGKRRSLTNFHSFRRWFVTKAEQAGQPENIIASVVGHKRQGMTLGVYSGGPNAEQFRTCVEAVKLPTAKMQQPEKV